MVLYTVCMFDSDQLMEFLDRIEEYEDVFFERSMTEEEYNILTEEYCQVCRKFDSKKEADDFYNFMVEDYDEGFVYDHENREWYN